MERVGVAPIGLFVVCLALVLAPIAGIGPPAGTDGGAVGTDGHPPTTTTGPGDGVENGVRWNASLAIDERDGYNETELAAIANRTMARVERVRNVEFERTVPIEFRSRSNFTRATRDGGRTVSTADRLHQNVKFEALFLVGEGTDAIRTRNANTASGVIAYYDPGRDTIVIIGSRSAGASVREPVLAQEFVHAYQFRHFDVGSYDRTTEETNNAALGLIEGDANLVQQHYAERCRGSWECLEAASVAGGGGPPRNQGLYLLSYFPYSDGPPFVDAKRRAGGWGAVDDLYRRPPVSTEQLIHPERYPDERPRNVSLARTGEDPWRVLELEGGIDHATFGEAGLNVMLVTPAIESDGRRVVIPASDFYNREDGRLNRSDPFDYDHPYTDGWDGDRLYPFVTDRSSDTNETGYVWKITFDSAADAREFRTGYLELLETRDAEAVADRSDVWRISEGPFADAFRVRRVGDTVVIVNGPRVESLRKIRPRNPSGPTQPSPEGSADQGVAFERSS